MLLCVQGRTNLCSGKQNDGEASGAIVLMDFVAVGGGQLVTEAVVWCSDYELCAIKLMLFFKKTFQFLASKMYKGQVHAQNFMYNQPEKGMIQHICTSF